MFQCIVQNHGEYIKRRMKLPYRRLSDIACSRTRGLTMMIIDRLPWDMTHASDRDF